MIKLELPYVTVTVDDRFRNRLALVGDRLRVTLTAYLRNAADDVGGAGPQGHRGLPNRSRSRRHRDGRSQRPHRLGTRGTRPAPESRMT